MLWPPSLNSVSMAHRSDPPKKIVVYCPKFYVHLDHLCPSLVFWAFCFWTLQKSPEKIIGLGPNAAPRSFRTWAPSVASISGKPLFPMWPKQGMDGPRFPVNGLVLKLTTATATSCATERGLNYEATLDLSPKIKIGVSKLDTFDIILRKFFSQHSKSDSPMRAPSVMFFVEILS